MSFRAERGLQCGSVTEFNRAGMANLTLLSLSFKKERDVSALPKQGEVNLARGCFTALMLRSA